MRRRRSLDEGFASAAGHLPFEQFLSGQALVQLSKPG